MLSFSPGLILLWLFLNDGTLKFYMLLFILSIFIVFFLVFGNLIHFIISLFSKHTVTIENDVITIKGRKKLTQSINLNDVKHVIFDQGSIGKGSSTPCSLTLHNHNFSETVIINNPSFLLCYYINTTCKNAKFKFNNYKFYIFLSILFLIMMLLICLFAK
jgi:hypothetical protein